MEIYTIGFGKKSAQDFFSALRGARIRRLVDVRLNNTSQLAGFTKRHDLAFFLNELCGAGYEHMPFLAPSSEILDAYKKKNITWADYEREFLALMRERRVEDRLDRARFEAPTVLLCSEPTPEQCHRRLVAEYLRDTWGGVEIVHL